jgi:2-oxoacid:acceptor oxidoreductase gamma subunit (pyruvate/2-ketoisovalerate family)
LTEKKYIQSFPAFGPERAGAPITAFTRISDKPIHIHSSIYEPDIVVVLDPTLLDSSVLMGVKDDTKILINTDRSPKEIRKSIEMGDLEFWVLDATNLALKVLGRPITNTAMLGALVKATGVVKIESLLKAIGTRFSGRVLDSNLDVIKKAYEEVVKG